MRNKSISYRIILLLIGLFTLAIGCWIWLYPPAIFPDPAWGFQVMRGMRMGGGFNMLPQPDMTDINKNAPSFLAWWSPGQYLVPYGFIKLFGLNIGRSMAITATLCSLIGLSGFYFFFKKTGFTQFIAAISIAFIAAQQAYTVPFIFYNGGEVLIFAFEGWFLYGCTRINKAGWWMAIFILASGIIGFFCKSSFLWIYFSGCLYLWIRTSNTKKISAWILNGLCIGVPAVLSLATIYVSYLSKGANPASGSTGIRLAWETFTFPLASPLLAGFSIDDITAGLIYHTEPALFNPTWTIIILLLSALVSLILITYLVRLTPYNNYKLLLMIFYTISVVFFGISFLRQASISYEARHMRIIGLIITPGIIYLLNKAQKHYRILFGIVWGFITFTTLQYLYTGLKRNKNETAHGTTGITQLFIDQPTLNYVKQLDNQNHNAIFTFISADLGLEIDHNRIITFNPATGFFIENRYDYKGHAGHLYLILPLNYLGTKADLYLKSFPGYHNFSVVKPGNYLIYSAQ